MLRIRSSERGQVLAFASTIVILVAGLSAAVASLSLAENKVSYQYNESLQAFYAAEAGLEDAHYQVNHAAMDLVGNSWLNAVAVPAIGLNPRDIAPGDTRALTRTVAENHATIEAVIYALDAVHQNFRILAKATLPTGQTVTLAQDLKAWDTFARFATFVDSGELQFGASTIDGDVHSNDRIIFNYGEGKFKKRVTAVNGFSFENGANPTNTELNEVNPSVGKIPMPSIEDLQKMGQDSTGNAYVSGNNHHYGNLGEKMDAQIHFEGDRVTIIATNRTSHITLTENIPIPSDGVIFVDGAITSIKGNVSDRVTVSATENVTITDNIRYVDAAGQPEYILTQDSVRVPNNETAPGTAWTAAAKYDYVLNPEFQVPTGTKKPTLGIMAGQNINMSADAPANLEIHSSLFAVNGTWNANTDVLKDNLRIVGSITTRTPGSRAIGDVGGYIKSGGYIYDQNLIDNPPPSYPKAKATVWGPRFKSRESIERKPQT